jgi:5-methylcytosine-specific restriction endonuclease McrA
MNLFTCTSCRIPKPPDAFAIKRANKRGRNNQCKECRSKYSATYYAKNRESFLAKAKAYALAHPKQRKAWAHSHYLANIKKRRAEAREASSRRYAENPRYFIEKTDKRRALKRKAPFVESVSIAYVYERDKGICQICLKACKRQDASRDHVIPTSLGGAWSRQNTVLAHLSCNKSKNNRTVPQQQRLFG